MNWIQRLFGTPTGTVSQRASLSVETGALPTQADLHARFASLSHPAVHLRPTATPTFSRLGGLPLLPADAEWPQWNGKPQAFLAQLDLSEIHAALPSFLPRTGYLYFFYDQEQSAWGFDPDDVGSWRVLYYTADRYTLKERPAPEGLTAEYIYKPKAITAHRIDLLPGWESLPGPTLEPESVWESFMELRAAPFQKMHAHQVLGYPTPVQGPNMDEECQLASNGINVGSAAGYKDPRVPELKKGAGDWKLLLQLETDDDIGWMWGDVGTVYFWVREQDAANGDFSKVWMVFQCS